MRLPLAALLVLLPAAAIAAPFGPFGSPGHPVTRDAVFAPRLPRVPGDGRVRLAVPPTGEAPSARPAPGPGAHPLGLAFGLYRDALTKVDGPRCAHRPSCSVYAMQAAEKRGLVGLFLAVDRLHRQGLDSPLRRLPRLVLPDGSLRLHDPLEFSDFFLEDER